MYTAAVNAACPSRCDKKLSNDALKPIAEKPLYRSS
jgi:hypothetical protein